MSAAEADESALQPPVRARADSARARPRTATLRPSRHGASRGSKPAPTSIGTGYLGVAATSLAALLTLFELGRFSFGVHLLPDPVLSAIAWLLLAALFVGLAFATRRAGDHLPTVVGAFLTVGLTAVVLLDLIAGWGAHDPGRTLTAAPAAVLVFIAAVGVRTTRGMTVSLAITGGLLTLGAVAGLATGSVTDGGLEAAVALVARALAPPVVTVLVVEWFRRTVGRELERVLVQSTVSAPRFAVGMLASEELTQLDDAAERLLSNVATGRERLPLRPASAQAAAHLATELRLHLIEGRRQTWLYHAITESDILGKQVTLSDPDSLAGLLDAKQRDGLLQAVWLLLGDTPERSRRSARRLTVEVTIGPAEPADAPNRLTVPISIDTTGVPRRGVDTTTWDAVRKVGAFTDSQRGGSLCIDITCPVERPDQN